ncbi:alkaline phosphatase [Asanoa ishikariensis]|uniref:Alkaline phosphatase D n=1 Tax=Asanoa ishikariensis TaxID=137265 RepID=A0A1H3TUK0_9ACTN|nr:alkaline phosphatase D family protein [Asanoa ishikariensis]GIF67495.1 alkaline phosphatase [Asanoa ishikariensis]SDZ53737.1 alkaline phosphatase D [Asanoa ishikariensis]
MSEFTVSRRQVLASAVAAGAVVAAGSPAAAHGNHETADPFPLGIASGDPTAHSVILWTRLARDLYAPGGLSRRTVEVRWEVATDERFRRVVRRGTTLARPELAHSVHVDAVGLEPGREYFYRFKALGELSPVGRTRTAPAPWEDPRALRFAIANCQDFQNGYWPAYDALADEDLDLVVHLGDYIYEYDPSSRFPDREHVAPETAGLDQLRTLSDYRNRHAQYKTDPALRSAHAAFPWVVTWDDHETENNYADLVDELDSGAAHQTKAQFAKQRAAAYQAYYEHMPIRANLRPGSPDLRIFRRFDYGRLLRLNVLDTRQYRSDQPGTGDFGAIEAGTGNTSGTLTGHDQERWLTKGLIGSPARWNVVAQQVMMSRTLLPNPALVPPTMANLDQWDGYAPQRDRLLGVLADRRVNNPVVLAGDIHSTWFSELHQDFDRLDVPPVAVEFVSTSISSDFPAAFDAPVKAVNPLLNPHVKYFDGLKRGYLRCTVDRHGWRTDVRTVDSIETRHSPVRTQASFAVAAGTSRIVAA